MMTDDFVIRNLGCASILLSSIWDSDFRGFGNLGSIPDTAKDPPCRETDARKICRGFKSSSVRGVED
ncbi:hypothetical protein TNCV_667431 [Trichonephila clavipes]|nr:hypothetical protein TNCV_667431 [Trichonephila clavipes]